MEILIQEYLLENHKIGINGIDYKLQDNSDNKGIFVSDWIVQGLEKPSFPQSQKNNAIILQNLNYAKDQKTQEVSNKRQEFVDLGFVHGGNTFFMDDKSILRMNMKKNSIREIDDDYTFYSMNRNCINFETTQGFGNFYEQLSFERNRIDKLGNSFKGQINNCITIEEVEGLTINFEI